MVGTEPAPTVVVGVGGAGIDAVQVLHDSDGLGWGEEYDDYFDYVVMDSSKSVVSNAPDKATKVYLESDQSAESDQEHYPYLNESFDIGTRGAKRQRPVGRSKLDNPASPGWQSHFEKVKNTIEGHINMVQNNPDIPDGQLNVVHVHSLGGGTGSGTFPLLGQMINEIVADVQARYPVSIYTAGIGVVPEIAHNIDLASPPGDPRYYANTYAALNDLDKMFNATASDPLELHLYSQHAQNNPEIETFRIDNLPEPQYKLTHSPYQHYFLLDVDMAPSYGEQMSQPSSDRFRDPSRSIIAGIYALAMFGSEIEGWLKGANLARPGFSKVGSFRQTQLSLPVEEIEQYLHLTEEIAELRELVDPETPDDGGALIEQRNRTQRERDRLQESIDEPRKALVDLSESETVEENITDDLETEIYLLDKVSELSATGDDLDELERTYRERHGEEIVPYLIEQAIERIETEGQPIEENWRDYIHSTFEELEIADEPGFSSQETAEQQAKELHRYFAEKIPELRVAKEEADEGSFLKNILRLDSGPDYDEWLQEHEDRRDTLEDWEQKKGHVDALKEHARERRNEVVDTMFKPRKLNLDDEITDLKREIEEKREELHDTKKNRDKKLAELTNADYGDRVGYLALDEQKVREELDRETFEEELTSLAAFENEGFLARDLGRTITARVPLGYAWEKKLMSFAGGIDVKLGDKSDDVREIWMLHSGENTDLPDFDQLTAGSHEFRRTLPDVDESPFPEFHDPYTIQFMSFTLTRPLTHLSLYKQLEEAANSGTLDASIDQWPDYQLAFAYPEWYGRGISWYPEVDRLELPRLPELDIDDVDSDKVRGELKKDIRSRGIASYLWQADEWDDYDGGYIRVNGFGADEPLGWKHTLGEMGLTYHDIANTISNDRPAKMWLAGQLSWDELLKEITEEIVKEKRIGVKLVPERD